VAKAKALILIYLFFERDVNIADKDFTLHDEQSVYNNLVRELQLGHSLQLGCVGSGVLNTGTLKIRLNSSRNVEN